MLAKIVIPKKRFSAPIVSALAILAALSMTPTAAQAFSGGAAGRTGSGCVGCHASQSGGVTVSISGPTTIVADQRQTYTLDIGAGGTGSGGAFDIAVSGGASLGLNAGFVDHSQFSGDEIVHTNARSNNLGFFSLSFGVIAPSTVGTFLDLAVVGMQFNDPAGNGSEDIWDFASLRIEVVPEPGTVLLLGMGLAGLAVVSRRPRA